MIKKSIYIIISIIFIVLFACTISQAETVEEIQTRIDSANQNRKRLEDEITKYQEQLKVIGGEAINLQNTIKSLDVSASKITSEVKLVETDINKTNNTIQDTSAEIKNKEIQINRDREAIKKSLRLIDEADNRSLWEILLSNEGFSNFWIEVDEVIKVQAEIGNQVNTVKNIKTNLENAKIELEQEKVELEKYTKELAAKKQVLQSTKNEKSGLLSETKNTEANFQKILNDKLALKQALDKEINQYESELRTAIDPKSFPPAKKGILSWPLDYIYITQNFGITSASGRLYTSGTHNGVDFRAAIGTRVKSAGNGIVEAVGDTDLVCPGASYGKWVFIRYDNGLASTYGHLSLITAKAGQRVLTGDVVAYSGNTGYSTGPHLHMSVYANQGVSVSTLKSAVCKGTYIMPLASASAYLDPLLYM